MTRESYAEAVDQLNRLALDPAGLGRLADEVLAVAGLLGQQPQLRRTLSDPARSGSERAELIGSLLAGKVSADAEALVRTLVAGRWSSSHELLTATERLGVEALLASADKAGSLADVEDELFRFGQIVDGDPQLAAALGSTTVPAAQRAQLATTLLTGKVKPATLRLVELSLHGFGGRNFAGSMSRLVELAARRRDRQIAYVTVAAPLTDAEEARLAARLEQIYGHAVEVKVTVWPHVLGGVSVRIGSDLYDGTVLRRLLRARTGLVGKKG